MFPVLSPGQGIVSGRRESLDEYPELAECPERDKRGRVAAMNRFETLLAEHVIGGGHAGKRYVAEYEKIARRWMFIVRVRGWVVRGIDDADAFVLYKRPLSQLRKFLPKRKATLEEAKRKAARVDG